MKKTLIVLSAGAALVAAHTALAANCKDLKSCAEVMYELKGQRYIWAEKNARAKLVMVPDVELTPLNAEQVFTALLDQVELAREPVGDGKTYRIIRSVMRKEHDTPILEASAEKAPKFPDTWDWVTMRYKTKDAAIAPRIEQMYRLHVPREARMQSDNNTGTLIITGPAPMVRHMYAMVKGADVPVTAAMRKRWAEQDRRWEARQKRK